MDENVRTENVRNDAHGQQSCCPPASSAKATMNTDPKTKSGNSPVADAARKQTESGCCCGSKLPQALNRFI